MEAVNKEKKILRSWNSPQTVLIHVKGDNRDLWTNLSLGSVHINSFPYFMESQPLKIDFLIAFTPHFPISVDALDLSKAFNSVDSTLIA